MSFLVLTCSVLLGQCVPPPVAGCAVVFHYCEPVYVAPPTVIYQAPVAYSVATASPAIFIQIDEVQQSRFEADISYPNGKCWKVPIINGYAPAVTLGSFVDGGRYIIYNYRHKIPYQTVLASPIQTTVVPPKVSPQTKPLAPSLDTTQQGPVIAPVDPLKTQTPPAQPVEKVVPKPLPHAPMLDLDQRMPPDFVPKKTTEPGIRKPLAPVLGSELRTPSEFASPEVIVTPTYKGERDGT